MYRKQRNFCSKLYKKERKKYYNNLDLNDIADNKKFWKTVKPFLSNKSIQTSQITLVDEDNIISEDSVQVVTIQKPTGSVKRQTI